MKCPEHEADRMSEREFPNMDFIREFQTRNGRSSFGPHGQIVLRVDNQTESWGPAEAIGTIGRRPQRNAAATPPEKRRIESAERQIEAQVQSPKRDIKTYGRENTHTRAQAAHRPGVTVFHARGFEKKSSYNIHSKYANKHLKLIIKRLSDPFFCGKGRYAEYASRRLAIRIAYGDRQKKGHKPCGSYL